jgi:hypothetical protein
VAAPTTPEVPAQAGGLHRKPPLEVSRRTAHDRGLGEQPATNLADDPIEIDSGEGVEMFEHKPGPGQGPHLLDHVVAEILPTLVTGLLIAVNEPAAGHARDALTVPHLTGESAERAESVTSRYLQGMVTRGKLVAPGRDRRWFRRSRTFGMFHGSNLLLPAPWPTFIDRIEF